jgi:DNA-binding transcriptional MocR family regulator
VQILNGIAQQIVYTICSLGSYSATLLFRLPCPVLTMKTVFTSGRRLSSVFVSSIYPLLAVVVLDASIIVTGFISRSSSRYYTGVKPRHHHQYQQRRHFLSTTGIEAMKQSSSSSGVKKNVGSGLSPRVLETLDPCVVLMKDLVGQYAHLWEDKGGIFSLAQGVVYWTPPPSCQEALVAELSKPSNILHTYGPAQGIPELTDALTKKIAEENGMTDHSVMVTVGANQAYVNTVLTCLCDDSKAIVFSP